jgi:hypothetical protein
MVTNKLKALLLLFLIRGAVAPPFDPTDYCNKNESYLKVVNHTPAVWTDCAIEGGTCACNGDVRYWDGALSENAKFFVVGSIAC